MGHICICTYLLHRGQNKCHETKACSMFSKRILGRCDTFQPPFLVPVVVSSLSSFCSFPPLRGVPKMYVIIFFIMKKGTFFNILEKPIIGNRTFNQVQNIENTCWTVFFVLVLALFTCAEVNGKVEGCVRFKVCNVRLGTDRCFAAPLWPLEVTGTVDHQSQDFPTIQIPYVQYPPPPHSPPHTRVSPALLTRIEDPLAPTASFATYSIRRLFDTA